MTVRIAVIALAAALWPLSAPARAQVSTTASFVWGQSGSFTTGTVNNGGIGTGSLSHPDAIAVDGSGNLYVADSTNNRVLYYTAGSATATRVYGQAGSFTTSNANSGVLRTADTLHTPTALALDASGNLYVSDNANNRVLYFAAGSTTATRVYGQAGSFTAGTANNGGIGANALTAPSGLALDASGNLYVSDTTNNRVLYYPSGNTTATRVYGQSGSFTTSAGNLGGNGPTTTNLHGPTGIALDAQGNLYVADNSNNRVLYYASGSTTATQVYGQLGLFTTNLSNSGGIGAATLNRPNGMAVDANGNLYIGDQSNNRVLYYAPGSTTASQVYGQGGSFTGSFTNGGYTPTASSLSAPFVALDAAGNLYVADSSNNRALRFYNTGSLSLSTGYSSPIYQSGPGTVTLTVASVAGLANAAVAVIDTFTADFTIDSASDGCSVSGQTVTCTFVAGGSAASTPFTVYVTASPTAAASISNTATLYENTDTLAIGSITDTVAIATQAPQVDSSLSQTLLSGSTDNGSCANGNMTFTASDLLQNTTGSTMTNPYAVVTTLSQGNTLISQSASSASVAANSGVTFTFHIQLANCNTFQLFFDVRSN